MTIVTVTGNVQAQSAVITSGICTITVAVTSAKVISLVEVANLVQQNPGIPQRLQDGIVGFLFAENGSVASKIGEYQLELPPGLTEHIGPILEVIRALLG
jgi:hypothetical protein